MTQRKRIERLERIALNQTLIIEQLSWLLRATCSAGTLSDMGDSSAEVLLRLIFEQGVPIEALDLACQWRQNMGASVFTRAPVGH